jgi:hypothetical protein
MRTLHVAMDMGLLSDTSPVVIGGGSNGMDEWCWRVQRALQERPCSLPPEASGRGVERKETITRGARSLPQEW